MDRFTQTDITKLMNHINSYPRKKWNGQAPLDLFIQIYGQETVTLLGLEKIPSHSINLTPALLKKQSGKYAKKAGQSQHIKLCKTGCIYDFKKVVKYSPAFGIPS